MTRNPANSQGPIRRARRVASPVGHCVICGADGTTANDFICSDCGDPLGVTLYCCSCGRRLALSPPVADRFLRENGIEVDGAPGLVLKSTRCSVCMSDDDTVDVSVYRIHLGTHT